MISGRSSIWRSRCLGSIWLQVQILPSRFINWGLCQGRLDTVRDVLSYSPVSNLRRKGAKDSLRIYAGVA